MELSISIAALFTVILSSLFPVSAVVYLAFQREKKIYQLEEDLKLLGITGNGNKENSRVSSKQSSSIRGSFLSHSMLPALLTIIGCFLLLDELSILLAPNEIHALRYGFLGAYVFSIQILYRRYTTFDLQPAVYLYCAITLIAGMAFNYTAASFLSGKGGSGRFEEGISAVVSFSLGYFPLLAIRWFNRISNNALGNKKERNNSLPLSIIDGISQFHETRLREEGIDNVQNLASAKIDELLVNTRFNAQQVLEWVDQAILHTYIQGGSWESFRQGGVRKISDFQELWKPYHVSIKIEENKLVTKISKELADLRRNRALQLQSTPEQLDSLFLTTATGPNIAYIETYWQNSKEAIQQKQNISLKESMEEAKSIIGKTQIQIFQEIGKLDYFDPERQRLGELAKLLTDESHEIAVNKQEANFFIGCGWWLAWLAGKDKDYKEEARKYYINAENEEASPRLFFELSLFYGVQLKETDSALDYANKAVELCQDNGNQLLLDALAVKGILYLAAGKQDDGKVCLDKVLAGFDRPTATIPQKEVIKKLNDIVATTKVLFEHISSSEFIEFEEKINLLQEGN